MAIKPRIATLTNSSVDILNAIHNSASTDYKNYVPIATPNAEVIREIGAVIMDNPSLQNEFLTALVNRIAKVVVTSRSYTNPWAMFKKGMLEYGETIEEIFVNIAKPHSYDPSVAERELYKREIPDVRSAFHIVNYEKFYKATIQEKDLKKAFLTIEGVTDLIAKIVDAMYTGAEYDEYQVMKYMLAKRIVRGQVYPVTVPTISADNAKQIVTVIKSTSNDFTFLKPKYNIAGVENNSTKDRQYLIMDSNFDATVDINVLASAFNLDKAEFVGKRTLVDGFGELDIARLGELFAGDPTYTEFSQDELNALNQIPAVLVDEDFFMIFDNLMAVRSLDNGEGLYRNYWYHCWKTFSTSPFANAAVFVTGAPSVTSISVTPEQLTASAGQSVSLSVAVETEHFASKAVVWSTDSEYATVSASGLVHIKSGASGQIVVTATSVQDPTKSATCTITVA